MDAEMSNKLIEVKRKHLIEDLALSRKHAKSRQQLIEANIPETLDSRLAMSDEIAQMSDAHEQEVKAIIYFFAHYKL